MSTAPKSAIETLEPHRKRKLKAFMRAPDPGNHSDRIVSDAFWSIVYGKTVVDHATAVAVEHELEHSDRSVGDVVDGWRPHSLEEGDRRARGKCDGNHGGPRCADPECWNTDIESNTVSSAKGSNAP